LAAERDDGLLVLMYNVSPDGDEALAVEARYARVDRAAEADGSHRPPASD
jgi:hypothetical protein